MRTYGRITKPDGTKQWVVVTTDASGYNDEVYLTALCQALLLNLGESPFYASYGIPARQSVQQQVAPDFYIARTQQQFAPYFANLTIAKQSGDPPTYAISVITNQGAKLSGTMQIPQ